jgi:hypothetical protein
MATSESLPATMASVDPARMSYRDYVELSSIEEYRKLMSLPPIETNELSSFDIDELIKKLQD